MSGKFSRVIFLVSFFSPPSGIFRLSPMTNGASKMAAASAGCGWSVLKWATGTNFAIQLAGFSIANWFKTEKFFDLTGAMTNIVVPSMCFFMGRNNRSSRLLVCKIQYACVVLWAARLGSFLFYRVMKDDGDRRFDKIKKSTASFFAAWMVQGVWVSLISLPTCCMFLMQKNIPVRPAPAHILGWSMFAVGFLLEAVADQQKLSFNSNKENEKEFMRSGLWSLSRHPNYLGT